MITLRLNAYSADELSKLFIELENSVLKECPSPSQMNCDRCAYRHLCYDIFAAQGHIEVLAEEALTK